MKKTVPFLKKTIFYLLGMFFAVFLYERIYLFTKGDFLPEFFTAFIDSLKRLGNVSFLASFGYTFLRSLIGLIVSFLLGFALGLFAGYYDGRKRFLKPLRSIRRSIPRIAIIFLLALYVPSFYYLVVFLLCFPICYEDSCEGSDKIKKRFGNQFRLDGNQGRKVFYFVIFPLSLPYYGRGIIQSFGLAFKAEIMAETFSYKSSFTGLGKDLYLAYQMADFAKLAQIIIILRMFLMIFDILLAFFKEKIDNLFF